MENDLGHQGTPMRSGSVTHKDRKTENPNFLVAKVWGHAHLYYDMLIWKALQHGQKNLPSREIEPRPPQ